ncbi:40s ribosomal protein s5-1 [Hordeum vulgare]|nr:40s ribosomal protein s5-1 [Hordeum vulgare]
MASPKAPKDKFFEKIINPYLAGVLQHPQSIKMLEGVQHICDVEGPKKTGSVGARLEEMEQQVFNCQGMVERGLTANHMMITEFTNKHKIDANDIGKQLSRLYDRIDHLQAHIYDLQNQNSSLSRTVAAVSEIAAVLRDVMSAFMVDAVVLGLEWVAKISFIMQCLNSTMVLGSMCDHVVDASAEECSR